MYCRYCGKQISDGSRFCTNCGKPQNESASEQNNSTVEAPRKKKIGLIIGIVAVVVALLGGGFLGWMYYRHVQEQEAVRVDEEARVAEEARVEWESYVSDLQDWLEKKKQSEEFYILDGNAERELKEMEDDIQSGIASKDDLSVLEEKKAQLEAYFAQLAESNTEELNTYIQQINEQNISFAQESDFAVIADYGTLVDSLIHEGKYRDALVKAQEWENYVLTLGAVYDDYTVTVSQYDISDFPNIKVYLDVTDAEGNFVDNLPASAFYVNEGRSIEGDFNRVAVTTAAKLNENAGISISLAADISGSMYYNMEQAKQAMRNFVNTVQFDKGDEIELTEFNESSYICQSFTSQSASILNSIDTMQAGGSTRLYDTLLSEIERIQSRSNAKCVIGFTDGFDNVSISSPQDVVNAAITRGVPVFLIGIGSDCDKDTLQYIAESTGGTYQNIDDVVALENVYNSIYKQEKEVYLVEYTVSDGEDFEGNRYSDIYIRTNEGTGGCVRGFAFDSQDFFELMYNKFLIAGIDCQTRGERNLLDSGLIVTSADAYADPDCVAYQSQAAINSGGVGANDSSTFEVLVYYDVISVQKDGDGYILYGVSNYDISKVRNYSSISNADEKSMINQYYGEPAGETRFWIEENRSTYEKLTLVKDTDGKWKFRTRVYERQDGGKAVVVNDVYNVMLQ